MGEKEEDPCFGTRRGYSTPKRFVEPFPSVQGSRFLPTGFPWGFRVEKEPGQGIVQLFGEDVRGKKLRMAAREGGWKKEWSKGR